MFLGIAAFWGERSNNGLPRWIWHHAFLYWMFVLFATAISLSTWHARLCAWCRLDWEMPCNASLRQPDSNESSAWPGSAILGAVHCSHLFTPWTIIIKLLFFSFLHFLPERDISQEESCCDFLEFWETSEASSAGFTVRDVKLTREVFLKQVYIFVGLVSGLISVLSRVYYL